MPALRASMVPKTGSVLRTHAPRGWRRFLRSPINGMFLQHAHGFGYRTLELRIATGYYVFGPVLDIDVGRDAFILDCPVSVARKESAARCDH